MLTLPPQSVSERGLVQSAYTLLHCNRRADIATIPYQEVVSLYLLLYAATNHLSDKFTSSFMGSVQDTFFVVHCEIVKLETRHGWMYEGCAKCGTKVKPNNANLMCVTCKKSPASSEPKYNVDAFLFNSYLDIECCCYY